MERIDIIELVRNQYTYENWSSKSQYLIESEIVGEDKVVLYYVIKKAIMKKRFQREFQRYVYLTPGFCWALGFFQGEGLKSRKNRAYTRFNITNKNPIFLKRFLSEMDKAGLLRKEEIKGRCFQIHHFLNPPEVVKEYWSSQLGFPQEKFIAIDYNHNLKKEGNGVCHFDIGDCLLRRVIDLINEKW